MEEKNKEQGVQTEKGSPAEGFWVQHTGYRVAVVAGATFLCLFELH